MGGPVNTRIRGAQRRTGRAGGPEPDDTTVVRRNWRTTLAATAVAALALGGMTALAAPAAAEEIADPAAVESVQPAESPAVEPAAPLAAEPTAEEPAPPAEAPAAPPAEEPAEPAAEEPATPPAEEPPPPAAEESAAEEAPAEEAAAPEAAAAQDVQVMLVPPGTEVVDKVEICHRTASYRNPYVVIEPSIDAILGSNNTQNAHYEEHQGPIFWPDIPKHTEWGDVIPPFYYDDDGEEPAYFPGYNWDATGQAIYEEDCAIAVPNPSVTYIVEPCPAYNGYGYFEITLDDLLETVSYRVDLYRWDGLIQNSWTIQDTAGSWTNWAYLPPDDYYFEVWIFNDDEEVQDWELFVTQDFTIGDCPDLGVMAEGIGCSLGDNGTAMVSLSGLIVDEEYGWELNGDDYALADTLVAPSESLDVPFGDLPPGNYEFTIWWSGDPELVYAQASFFVEPCPPDISVVVEECPAYGGEGGAVVKLSDLVEGMTYEVWIVDQHENGVVYGPVRSVVGDATHTAEVDVSPLPAGTDFTAYVYAPWMPTGGSSEWGEVDWFEVVASVDFSLEPCPAKPAKHEPVTPVGLADTGAGGTDGMLAAAMILLGLGGATLIASRRRAAGARVKD